jgi:Ca-activated chloride channel family protein
MRLASPLYLLLLLLIPLLLALRSRKGKLRDSTIIYSDLRLLSGVGSRGPELKRSALRLLRMSGLALLIIALARPQSGESYREIRGEGIDIILAVDVSSSMLAEDFKPLNRLHVAKQTVQKFISERVQDRIGLVAFAGKAFTQCPLTLDYGVLKSFVERLDVGLIEDGTAIGTAIATAVNRLRNSDAESKLIILLTDGRNNAGKVDPITAARLARSQGIKIYTVGAGKRGMAMYPIEDPIFGKRYVRMPVEIDEDTLRAIADETGGAYFRATDAETLDRIYERISQMERTEFEIEEYVEYSEQFAPFLFAGLLLVLLEIILADTLWRRLP